MTSPETVAALRWALFTERVWPADVTEIEADLPARASSASKAARAKARLALRDIRDLIYPKD